jgi:hypothetical protein
VVIARRQDVNADLRELAINRLVVLQTSGLDQCLADDHDALFLRETPRDSLRLQEERTRGFRNRRARAAADNTFCILDELIIQVSALVIKKQHRLHDHLHF